MPVELLNNLELHNYRINYRSRTDDSGYVLMDENDSLVRSFILNKDIDTPVIDLTLELAPSADPTLYKSGDIIEIFGPKIEYNGTITALQTLYVGYIFRRSVPVSAYSLQCKNLGYYISTNDRYFKINQGETATDFIRRICADNGIPLLDIVQTEYLLPAKFIERKSIYATILDALTQSMIEEDKKYYMYFHPRGLIIQDVTDKSEEGFVLEDTEGFSNVMSPSLDSNILDREFVNVARGRATNEVSQNELLSEIQSFLPSSYNQEFRNERSVAQYGEFIREYDITNKGIDGGVRYLEKIVSQAKPTENVMLTTFATNNIKPTDRIFVKVGQIGASGEYFVKHVTSNIQSGSFLETITASKVRDIPQEQLAELEQSQFIINGVDLVELARELEAQDAQR